MQTKYDVLMPPSRLDRSIDAAIAQHNEAFLLTICRVCSGTGARYTKTATAKWDRHPCLTCGGTGDPQ